MAKNIKERILILSELDVIIETLDNNIKLYELWADEPGVSDELVKDYLSTAMLKTKVRDMVAKLADSV